MRGPAETPPGRPGEVRTRASGGKLESEPMAARSVPLLTSRGARIPALGFGTWQLRGASARRIVERALELGYRHLDTAQIYGNESDVGRAAAHSGVPRGELFLVTKVWPDRYRAPEFRESVRESLERLRTDYVDLLLLHWPRFEGTSLEATLEELARAREEGLARHVGVSNFTVPLMERAESAGSVPIVTNQVEYHPFLDQSPLLLHARERGLALTAYCPLAKGRAPRDPTLRAIGDRHRKSAAQVALRWLLQQEGVAAIPRTSDPRHLADNLDVLDFELSEDEMGQIAALGEERYRVIDPVGLAPEWDQDVTG